MSKCGFCGAFMWEVKEESPHGSAFKVNFLRCSICKVPVGVIPYYDLHTKLVKMEEKIKKLEQYLPMLLQIDENVRRLFQK